MRWEDLAGPLASRGLDLLAAAIGGPAGPIVTTVGREIARQIGVSTPEEVADALAGEPEESGEALAKYQAANADMLRELSASQHELAMVEVKSEHWFQWAWRPAMSWQLIIFWFWSGMIIPLAAGITGVKIEAIPFDQLFAYTGVWLTIYGGGHTLKTIMGPKGPKS